MALTTLISEFRFHCSDLTIITITICGPRGTVLSNKSSDPPMGHKLLSFFLAREGQIKVTTKLLQNKIEGKKKWTCAVHVGPTMFKFMANLVKLTDPVPLQSCTHGTHTVLQDLQWCVSHLGVSMGLGTVSFPVTSQLPLFPEFKLTASSETLSFYTGGWSLSGLTK